MQDASSHAVEPFKSTSAATSSKPVPDNMKRADHTVAHWRTACFNTGCKFQ